MALGLLEGVGFCFIAYLLDSKLDSANLKDVLALDVIVHFILAVL